MPNDKERGTGAVVTLRDRFLIFPSSPLLELATPSADAFVAEDRRDRDKSLFALVVKPGFTPRIPVMKQLKGLDNAGLMNLVEWGVADWAPANRKVMILVYVRPLGGALWDAKGCNVRRLDENEAIRRIIQPAVSAFKLLKQQGLTHRAIRPTNMYWATAEKDRMVFGDAATTPPAFDQPAAVEPVESALSQPAGRGDGTIANDIYSFGASLAMILQSRDNSANLPEETVIRHKMVLGSYSALAGDARLPLALVEILRGMLCDDANERWDTEALDFWIGGRRLTPLVSRVEKRAIRAFVIGGKEYMTARELAIGLHQNWDMTLSAVGDGKLELWLRRALDLTDKATVVASALAVEASGVDRRVVADLTVAKLCMILDNSAPIRYKTLSCMSDGFRWLLPMAMANGGDVRIIAESIMRELPKAWFETREAYNPDNSVLESGFRTQKGYLDRGTIGNGLERVLYEICDSVPCLSPMLAEDYVVELRDLLPALNAYAKKKGETSPGPAIDRHIAAFIAARTNFDVDRQIGDLSITDPARQIMAMINLLAMIQWRLGQTGMVSLTLWLANMAKPAIEAFHNRAKRQSLEQELPKVAREGSVVELSRLLDSAEEKGADYRGFEEARQHWLDAYQQVRSIEEGREEIHDEATKTGQQMASLISISVAFITFAVLLLGMIM